MTRPSSFFLITILLALLHCSTIIGVSARSDNIDTTADIITVSIPIFRIDLTFLSNGNRKLLRGGNQLSDQDESSQTSTQLSQRALQSSSTNNNNDSDSIIDETIQSVAESHLTTIYTQQFLIEPSQVLLTVATTNTNNDSSSSSSSSGGLTTNGIYIRSSFLGGVVSFPTTDQKGNELNIPTRNELEKVTVNAFRIPGYGELFLNDLKDVGSDELGTLRVV